uniref:hypothetical protein n=1 Tax=Amycolatopsis sp. CA-096443 TaxID=3239919 RepID=UPI003F4915C2
MRTSDVWEALGLAVARQVIKAAAAGASGLALVYADDDALLTTAVWDATRRFAVPVLNGLGLGHGGRGDAHEGTR